MAARKSKSALFALTRMPSGKGGVRFEAENGNAHNRVEYVSQEQFEQLGSPERIRVTVAAA